jgi:NAD(P) transhydrogenase subunit beta
MTPTWAQLAYLVAAVCFIVALKGLSSPRTARRGNLIGAAGAVLATATVFLAADLDHVGAILVALGVGTVLGALGAYRVQMTQMPQLVALFNGVGGGAAAIVALVELDEISHSGGAPLITLIATAFTILVGAVSFTGSIITFLKLQEWMTTRPVTFAGYPLLYGLALLSALGFGVGLVLAPTLFLGLLLAVLGAGVGVLLVLPVGGADVPIVISLLNAFTGLTVAAGGYVLANPLLLVAGTLVGAAGTLLTQLMARAMGRPLLSTLFGALKGGSTLGGGAASDRPVRAASPADVAILLAYASRVIIEQLVGAVFVPIMRNLLPAIKSRSTAARGYALSTPQLLAPGTPVSATRTSDRRRGPDRQVSITLSKT